MQRWAMRWSSCSTTESVCSSALSSPPPHALRSCVTSTFGRLSEPCMAAALAWGREKYHIDPRRANGRRIKFLTACMTLLSQNSRYIK